MVKVSHNHLHSATQFVGQIYIDHKTAMVLGLNFTRKCTDVQQTEQSVTKNKNNLGFALCRVA